MRNRSRRQVKIYPPKQAKRPIRKRPMKPSKKNSKKNKLQVSKEAYSFKNILMNRPMHTAPKSMSFFTKARNLSKNKRFILTVQLILDLVMLLVKPEIALFVIIFIFLYKFIFSSKKK